MQLRKCPCCPNMIAVDTIMCPICGCNPRLVRIRRYAAAVVALGIAAWLIFAQTAH